MPWSRKAYRLLLLLVLVLGVGIPLVAVIIRQTAGPVRVQQRLAFGLVAERFGGLKRYMTRELVESMIGPPNERNASEPAFRELESQLEHFHRHIGLPEARCWHKWSDPKDPAKWVAIFYAGDSPATEMKVYYVMKNGF